MGRICVHAHELRMCVYGIYVIHMRVPAGVHCVVCADIHVFVHACLLYVGHAHICTKVCMYIYVRVHVCVYMWRPEINLSYHYRYYHLVF